MIVINPKTQQTIEAYSPTDDYANSTLEVRECMVAYRNYSSAVTRVPQQRAAMFFALQHFRFKLAFEYWQNMRWTIQQRNIYAGLVLAAVARLKNQKVIQTTWGE